jgi:hypothetical protein
MKRSNEMAIYNRHFPVVKNGRFASEFRPEQVRVMARAEGYAMVRLKGNSPFVVPEKELHPIPQEAK